MSFNNNGLSAECAFSNCRACENESCECPCHTKTHYEIAQEKLMNNLPQAVTDRYVTNLLHNGVNAEFRLDSMCCFPWCAEERICGHYYKAVIFPNGAALVIDVGPTPQAALKNALSKAGVTFR